MFERPNKGERALLVQLSLPNIDSELALVEFKELARSAGAIVIDCIQGNRKLPDAHSFIGRGKAEEIQMQVQALEIEVVLINHELTPSQERNLEQLFQCRVVDRTGLILDIFAQRARTFEGKLQVELAQLEHLSTRLVRGWTHLERQKGGIGLRGPGETQLETDRRLLRKRITTIHNRLEKVRRSRDQNRRARRKADLATISLVGYTNSGKSTLFNALTGGHSYAANQLFATLDPTMRKLEIPGARAVILADTVGFIRDLPHQLVDAFHATLEETREADLLLHVIDIADTNWREQVAAVEQVLSEIGAQDLKRIQVFNKIDLQTGWLPKVDYQENSCKIWLSAQTGAGFNLLLEAIARQLNGNMLQEQWLLKPEEAKLRAQLYALNAVLKEEALPEGGWCLLVYLSEKEKKVLKSTELK